MNRFTKRHKQRVKLRIRVYVQSLFCWSPDASLIERNLLALQALEGFDRHLLFGIGSNRVWPVANPPPHLFVDLVVGS